MIKIYTLLEYVHLLHKKMLRDYILTWFHVEISARHIYNTCLFQSSKHF